MLDIGDSVPSLELPDQSGTPVQLSSLYDQGNLVVFFYPKDESFGCTRQACSFRDEYEVFREHGAEVVGISSDDPESHRQFIDNHDLPFPLLCDPDGEARKAFGVPDTLGVLPGRATFVIDSTGTIQKAFNSQFRFGKHVEEALEVIASHSH